MAGYICKIVIEDTHPPVWRRVVIPDKITFFELHQIIQTVFQWEDVHLHDFRIPSDDIVINDEGEDGQGYNYGEFDTTIDYIFENYKWIRYTYDFGDDWRHRINIEKYDPEYICEKMPAGSDFDYAIHFHNAEHDEYYYCIHMEMGHTIYHRFTEADYLALL